MALMSKIIILNITLYFSFSSFANDLKGKWSGKGYDISLSDTFNNIKGYWGDKKFDLYISETFQDIEGKIGGSKVDIDVSSTFHDIEGILPCGIVNYDYSVTFKDIEGIMCGQKFEINLDHKEDVIPAAQTILLDQILKHFPAPMHSSIKKFIISRIHF